MRTILNQIQQIAAYQFFNLSIVVYSGILTLILLLLTATLAFLIRRSIIPLPIKWHIRFARLTIISAIIHATLALSLRF